MVLLMLVAGGPNNSAKFVSHDVGDTELLDFSPRIAILQSFAVGFSEPLLILTKTLFLWHSGGPKLIRVLDVTVWIETLL